MIVIVLFFWGKFKVEIWKLKKEEMEIVFIVVEEGKILLFCFVKFSLNLWEKKINK